MTDHAIVITGLIAGTAAIRGVGYLIGSRLPSKGPWAVGLNALPGCMIAALLAITLAPAGLPEWGAALVSLGVALWSRSLPLTMAIGVATIALLNFIL